jgi:acetylornithine deacetylase/succinyl-diaminopimelate desuccinylase-like protein
VVWELQRALGVPISMIGFGLPGDNIHAPNEHLHVDLFHQGVRVGVRLLAEYAARSRRQPDDTP